MSVPRRNPTKKREPRFDESDELPFKQPTPTIVVDSSESIGSDEDSFEDQNSSPQFSFSQARDVVTANLSDTIMSSHKMLKADPKNASSVLDYAVERILQQVEDFAHYCFGVKGCPCGYDAKK